VVESFAPTQRSFDENAQIVCRMTLADVFSQMRRPQRQFKLAFFVLRRIITQIEWLKLF
jgi:hypothetical protein